jgi:hypothetical protein
MIEQTGTGPDTTKYATDLSAMRLTQTCACVRRYAQRQESSGPTVYAALVQIQEGHQLIDGLMLHELQEKCQIPSRFFHISVKEEQQNNKDC